MTDLTRPVTRWPVYRAGEARWRRRPQPHRARSPGPAERGFRPARRCRARPDRDLVAAGAVDARACQRPLRRHVHAEDRLRGDLGDARRPRGGQAGLHRRPARLPRRRGQPDPRARSSAQLGPRPRREAPHRASASCCCRPSTASGCRATARRWPRSPRARSRAGRPAPPTSCARGCRRSPWRSSSSTVFGVHEGERMAELRVALRDFLDLTTNPRLLAAAAPARPRADPALPALPPPHRPRRRADPPRDRRAPRADDLDERDDILSMLVARPPRGRQPDERRGDARRAPHPARRRPRDDRDLALLGDGAPGPPPGEARAPARRGRGRRGRVPDRDDPGDAAPAPGDRRS